MALTITTPTLTTSFTSTEVDTNFADVRNKFGSITDADIAASAGIAASKLAVSYQEVWLELSHYQAIGGSWPAAPVSATAPTKTECLAVAALPGTDADTAWTVTDVSWLCNDTGAASGSFDVRYGAYGVGGVMAGAGTVCTGVAMTFKGNDLGNQGRALEGGSVALTQSTTVRCLYLVSAGAGTTVMDAATSWLKIMVALRRQITA